MNYELWEWNKTFEGKINELRPRPINGLEESKPSRSQPNLTQKRQSPLKEGEPTRSQSNTS